jgi:hypothetical protein
MPKQPPTEPPRNLIERLTIAAYAGAVSRFLDLAGIPVDLVPGHDKAAAEFEAFNDHLSNLAAENRRIANLEF